MRRFLIIYIPYQNRGVKCVAEGLIHYDGAVYANGFSPSTGQLFYSMADLQAALRNNDDIRTFHIHIVDSEERL